ncbi:hypothetical protein HY256_03940, partial [Candidatus Sumerlaeota bacterium]|nr:hypothetical protein [Candidatus Sumerlaeota bacterium]
MKTSCVALLISAAIFPFAAARAEESAAPLKLVQTIALPGVEGRFDHFAFDPKGTRLFVAALGNNTLEVLDLKSGAVRQVGSLHEPQGVAFLPDFNRVAVANGEGGECDFLDAETLKPVGKTKLDDDADNARYDAGTRRVYVGY